MPKTSFHATARAVFKEWLRVKGYTDGDHKVEFIQEMGALLNRMKREQQPDLTPVDLERCQVEVREGSFMSLGPRGMVRCHKQPSVIVKELKKGKDGKTGSMSMCSDCFIKFQKFTEDWEKTHKVVKYL